MLSRFRHNYFALAAILTAAVFGAIEIAAPWTAGAGRVDLNTPLGLVARYLAALYTPAVSLLRAGSDRTQLTWKIFLVAIIVLIALCICLLYLRLAPGARRSEQANSALVVAQLFVSVFLDSVLLNLVVAAQLGALMPLRAGLMWLAVQIGIGLSVDLYLISTVVRSDDDVLPLLLNVSLERLVQVLAFGIGYIAALERRSRLSLAATNAELLATQSLLGEMVRTAERMRIARDLHDAVGHHLTALNLHLDLALRQSEGVAAESLRTSRGLAHDMLAEVRTMVGTERGDRPIQLRHALQTLCDGIPAPAVRLSMASNLDIESAAAAHALFCCAREAITNAVRHADADVVTIDLRYQDQDIVLTIADDGRGSGAQAEGNGLRGMRERLALLGGRLTAGNQGAGGFGLDIRLPRAGGLL